MKELISSFAFNKIEKQAFLITFFSSCIALLSLLQANILYADDIGRVISGYPGWQSDGRPATNFISILIQTGQPLTDISPLPQIAAVALYSLSSIYLGKAFNIRSLTFLSLNGIIFVLNPFNLQIFCFIFDSFTIGFAVLTATITFYILQLLLDTSNSLIKKSLLSILLASPLLLLTLSLYQFGTSIYIGISAFYLLVELLEKRKPKESIQNFSIFLMPLLLSLILYFFVKEMTVDNSYIVNKSEIPSLANLPFVFIGNSLASTEYIFTVLRGAGNLIRLILILFVIVVFKIILMICGLGVKNEIKNEALSALQRVYFLLLILLYLLSVFFSFYGIPLLFENPSNNYLPRFFMGFSAICGISCLFLSRYLSNKNTLNYALLSLLCVLCLSFSNVSLTLGNVLHYQDTKEKAVATVLLADLNSVTQKLNGSEAKPKVAFLNDLGYGDMSNQAFIKYPILEEIVISYFRSEWWQTHNRLVSLGFDMYERGAINDNLHETSANPDMILTMRQADLIVSRHAYNIYTQEDGTFLIFFKDDE